jgi:hypothetical protein
VLVKSLLVLRPSFSGKRGIVIDVHLTREVATAPVSKHTRRGKKVPSLYLPYFDEALRPNGAERVGRSRGLETC